MAPNETAIPLFRMAVLLDQEGGQWACWTPTTTLAPEVGCPHGQHWFLTEEDGGKLISSILLLSNDWQV